MNALSEDVQRVARTYSAAADHFLAPALGFWDRWGAATVSRLGLEPLLALGRARAERERLTNIEFRHCDATQTGLEAGSFDAVVCVFGVFFASDMPDALAELFARAGIASVAIAARRVETVRLDVLFGVAERSVDTDR